MAKILKIFFSSAKTVKYAQIIKILSSKNSDRHFDGILVSYSYTKMLSIAIRQNDSSTGWLPQPQTSDLPSPVKTGVDKSNKLFSDDSRELFLSFATKRTRQEVSEETNRAQANRLCFFILNDNDNIPKIPIKQRRLSGHRRAADRLPVSAGKPENAVPFQMPISTRRRGLF